MKCILVLLIFALSGPLSSAEQVITENHIMEQIKKYKSVIKTDRKSVQKQAKSLWQQIRNTPLRKSTAAFNLVRYIIALELYYLNYENINKYLDEIQAVTKEEAMLWLGTIGSIRSNTKYRLGYLEQAEILLIKSIELSRAENDRFGLLDNMVTLGELYRKQEKISSALIVEKKALELAKKQGRKISQSVLMFNIGDSYSRRGEYLVAEEYFRDALKIHDVAALQASIEIEICKIRNGQSKYLKGIRHCRTGLDIFIQINDKPGILNAKINLATILKNSSSSENIIESYSLAKESVASANRLLLKDQLIRANFVYSDIILNQGNKAEARTLSESNLELAISGSYSRHVMRIYEQLYRIEKESENFEKTTHYLEKYLEQVIGDYEKEKLEELEYLSSEFKVERKNSRMEILYLENKTENRQLKYFTEINQSDLLIGGTIVGGLLFIFFTVYLRVKKTYLNKTNAERKKAVKIRNIFFQCVSHQLRTPLHAITSIVHLQDRREIFDNFDIIKMSCISLNNLVDNMDWCMARAQAIQLNVKDACLYEIADYSVKMTQLANANLQVKIDNRIERDLILSVDESRMMQIFINIIDNALKHTKVGNIVLTSKRIVGSRVQFFISDTGNAISKEHLDVFLEPFKNHENVSQDMGLGLSVAKALIELHGGEISVSSIRGKGTKVSFLLSTKDCASLFESNIETKNIASVAAGISTSENSGAIRSHRYNDVVPYCSSIKNDQCSCQTQPMAEFNILIVNDNYLSCLSLKSLLENGRYKITICTSARRALHICEQIIPSLVIVDLIMAEMDAISFCKEVRKYWSDKFMPIICVTEQKEHVNIVNCLNAGANDIVTNPLINREFRKKVEGYSMIKTDNDDEPNHRSLEYDLAQKYGFKNRLRTSRKTLKKILDSVNYPVCVIDSLGAIIVSNNHAEDEIPMQQGDIYNISEILWHNGERLSFLQNQKYQRQSGDFVFEDAVVKKDGLTKKVTLAVSKLESDEGLYKVSFTFCHNEEQSMSYFRNPTGKQLPDMEGEKSNQSKYEESFFKNLVELLIKSIGLWERETGLSKLELAERSKIWRISMDDGRLRTRTLDRYLSVVKLPKNPKWRRVVRTALFVVYHEDVVVSPHEEREIKDLIAKICSA